MAAQYQNLYYADFPRKILQYKMGISLDKVKEKLTEFYARLTATRLKCFVLNPCHPNEKWVRDYYVKLSVVFITNLAMTI